MVPRSLPGAVRKARPTTWVTSIFEDRGSAKMTASTAGTLIPSARHRTEEINRACEFAPVGGVGGAGAASHRSASVRMRAVVCASIARAWIRTPPAELAPCMAAAKAFALAVRP